MTKVLYIAGCGRSGSTILHNVMSQVHGFTGIGELSQMWNKFHKRKCGCGQRVNECPFWTSVFERMRSRLGDLDWEDMQRNRSLSRTRNFWLTRLPFGKRLYEKQSAEYRGVMEALYQSVQEEANARVIVDESKSVLHAHLLRTIPSIDLYVIHLIRDPRGIANSLLRRNEARKKHGLMQYTPLWIAFYWNTTNRMVETFKKEMPDRYFCLHYEDFASQPQPVVQQVLGFLQEPTDRLPFVDERTVELGVTHTVGGNRSRHHTGAIELQVDEGWRTDLAPSTRATIERFSRKLMKKYGYL
jgi:hypothetical protein